MDGCVAQRLHDPHWNGPVGQLPNDAAKLFASLYALFSGLVFISVMAILITPVAHRLLHRFHIAEEDFESVTGKRQDSARTRD